MQHHGLTHQRAPVCLDAAFLIVAERCVAEPATFLGCLLQVPLGLRVKASLHTTAAAAKVP